jgi:hypothetical protein
MIRLFLVALEEHPTLDQSQPLPAILPPALLGLGLPLIFTALDQGVNDPVGLSGTRQH